MSTSDGRGKAGNVIAAIASFFIPGLGQLVQGRLLPAVLFFVFAAGSYALSFLILPLIVAVPVHLWAIIDAAVWKPKE
jgi:TM2 domain-containing membrane protein YozV